MLAGSWQNANRISPSSGVVTGTEDADASAEKPMADKPMFIYVRDAGETSEFDKVDKVILDDNKVLVGMWAFRCVKMTPDDVQDDPLLADEGKEVPRFIFVSRDYSKVTVLEGSKLKTKKVFDTMSKFAKRDWKVNLKKCYKDTMKVLNEFDKINGAMKTLKQKEARLGDEISKADAKKMAKEKEELEERQKAAEEARDKLLTFKLKDKKA